MRGREDLKASLGELPTFVLEQMAAANRELACELRGRLAAGEPVPPMYQGERLDHLDLVAEVAEELVVERARRGRDRERDRPR